MATKGEQVLVSEQKEDGSLFPFFPADNCIVVDE